MTKNDVQKIIFKKCEPISSEIINTDCLEVLNKMISTKEMEVVIEGYSDNRIHTHDARIELWVLYKARELFEKENAMVRDKTKEE